MREQRTGETLNKIVLFENPYDMETFAKALQHAEKHNKYILFLDRFITVLRCHPSVDIVDLIFRLYVELNIMEPINYGKTS